MRQVYSLEAALKLCTRQSKYRLPSLTFLCCIYYFCLLSTLPQSESFLLFPHVKLFIGSGSRRFKYYRQSTRWVSAIHGIHADGDPSPPSSALSTNATAFAVLAERIAETVVQSDRKRDTGFDGASTGWTSWVDQNSAERLQTCIDQLRLVTKSVSVEGDSHRQKWLRWIRSCPEPMLLELSPQLRDAVRQTSQYLNLSTVYNDTGASANTRDRDETAYTTENNKHNVSEFDFFQRIGMRLIYLPSGRTLARPLQSAPGAMVYGTLFMGGVTRFRLIGTASGGKRRAGERTVIFPATAANDAKKKPRPANPSTGDAANETMSWLQYGGPERNYQAIDMGPCLLLEILLLPTGLEVPPLNEPARSSDSNNDDMVITAVPWEPENFFSWVEQSSATKMPSKNRENAATVPSGLSICDLETNFCSTIGGLQPQINEIVRRVLDGRVVRPVNSMTSIDGLDTSQVLDRIRREEMEGLLALGLQPVRGLLLYGPSGCGKTHLAREISTILDARPPKIVAAPELLDRWVGGTERMVRELFADAEYELNVMCGGDATRSALHVIVVDEIDAVFRKRSAADTSSEVTRASAVNQILAKLDGIQALGNVLFIGMTNRRELLDPALLRPGRLEVQVEIPNPDTEGRRAILRIHFEALRARGRLSRPLCNALDGSSVDGFISIDRLRRLTAFTSRGVGSPALIRDLAADRWTGGFSGADLAGLVRNAGSIALERARTRDFGGVENLLITLEDVGLALAEIK